MSEIDFVCLLLASHLTTVAFRGAAFLLPRRVVQHPFITAINRQLPLFLSLVFAASGIGTTRMPTFLLREVLAIGTVVVVQRIYRQMLVSLLVGAAVYLICSRLAGSG